MKIESNALTNQNNYNPIQKSQDSQIKAIQNQIQNIRKQMQSLEGNKKLSPDERVTKQKELQDQLDMLNQKILERQKELMEKKVQSKANEDVTVQNKDQESLQDEKYKPLQNVVEATVSYSQTKKLSAIKKEMVGKAKILRNEIQLDRSRGNSSEHKETELSRLEENIEKTSLNLAEGHKEVNKLLKKSRSATEEENKAQVDKNDAKEVDGTESNEVKDNVISDEPLSKEAKENSEDQSDK